MSYKVSFSLIGSGSKVVNTFNKILMLTLVCIVCILMFKLPCLSAATLLTYESPSNNQHHIDDNYTKVKTISIKQLLDGKENWHATAYNLKQRDNIFFETSQLPAKLCFVQNVTKKEICFFALEDTSLPYQEVKELSIVQLEINKEPMAGVVFIAKHHGQTLGKTLYVSIWTFDKQTGSFINLLPKVSLSDQSEYKIYPSFGKRGEAILITADRIWNSNKETLYGRHKFEVKIFKLDGFKGYKLHHKYITKKKYPSYDEVENIEVIGPELNSIKKLL